MIIERMEIRNFRCLRDVTLECDELTTILGRNGSGKSTLLKALDVFYNVSYQANPYDYFAKDTNATIKICVTYADLRTDELAAFAPYLTANKLSVTKLISSGGAKYFGVAKQIAKFNEIRKVGATEKRQLLNAIITAGEFPGLGPKVTTGGAAVSLMDQYEKEHPELTMPFETEGQFFGARNVGAGKLDNFTKFVLIPGVRDASAEVGSKGVIHQLIDVLVARTVSARPDVRALNKEFEERVKAVYSKGNLTELDTLAITITSLLKQYAPGTELGLDFEDVVPPKISLPGALASLVEDNFSSPIGYSGHGVQRALVLALLHQLSLTDVTPVVESKSENAELPNLEGGEVEQPTVQRPPDVILAIEEPELYLHPSRSRHLASVLDQLAAKPGGPNDPRTQVIFGTHSPYFIELGKFDRLRLTRKIPTPITDVRQCKVTSFTRAEASSKLSALSGKDPATFTAQSFVAHATPVMNSIVNEGFFADVVVVVEGISDVATLWAMQEIMKANWEALGIAAVPAGGKNNIDRPVVVFNGLGIPTYFIFDGDAHHSGKQKNESIARNKRYQILAEAKDVVDSPETQVHKTWAVFNKCLEEEIKSAIGSDYHDQLCQEVGSSLGYDDPLKALKNPEGASIFIKAAYAKGFKVPVLEQIVAAVTGLKQE